jgi:hypothetical protein
VHKSLLHVASSQCQFKVEEGSADVCTRLFQHYPIRGLSFVTAIKISRCLKITVGGRRRAEAPCASQTWIQTEMIRLAREGLHVGTCWCFVHTGGCIVLPHDLVIGGAVSLGCSGDLGACVSPLHGVCSGQLEAVMRRPEHPHNIHTVSFAVARPYCWSRSFELFVTSACITARRFVQPS